MVYVGEGADPISNIEHFQCCSDSPSPSFEPCKAGECQWSSDLIQFWPIVSTRLRAATAEHDCVETLTAACGEML